LRGKNIFVFLPTLLNIDVSSVLGWLRLVVVGDVAEGSKEHTTSIFRFEFIHVSRQVDDGKYLVP
jgi:hypothetical protein